MSWLRSGLWMAGNSLCIWTLLRSGQDNHRASEALVLDYAFDQAFLSEISEFYEVEGDLVKEIMGKCLGRGVVSYK